jgi:hypothetical protein
MVPPRIEDNERVVFPLQNDVSEVYGVYVRKLVNLLEVVIWEYASEIQ